MASSTSSAKAAPEQKAANQTSSVAITMFCVLLVSYVLMAADRYLFPVLATDVRKDFNFSLPVTALLTTIFTAGLGLAGLATGYLLARYSRKTVILIGIAIFSGATALTTVATGFFSMLVVLAAQGIGMSMLATSMFALAASYFSNNRTAAIGSVNFCYGIGGWLGPRVTGFLRTSYGTWHAPMLYFGAAGFVMIVVIMATVRPWFSETQQAAQTKADMGGAETLMNRNTIILTILSLIHGLSMYGFLGMYPTFLRDELHYTPGQAGAVVSFFGLGALTSIFGGWLGDKLAPRAVLSSSLFIIAALGYVFYMQDLSMLMREVLTCIYGIVGSAVLYVNLAGCHVRALRRSLSSKGSGMFVTSLYAGGAFGGYFLGKLVAPLGGYQHASEISMTLTCLIGAVLALALRPSDMSV